MEPEPDALVRCNPVTRELYLIGGLEADTPEWFVPSLRRLEIDEAPITVVIDSVGGDVSAAYTIYDLLRASPCDIVTLSLAEVLSAAIIVVCAGTRRIVLPSTVMMVHAGEHSGNFPRALGEQRARIGWSQWTDDHYLSLLARHSLVGADEWRKRIAGSEHWLLGADAILAEGLADEVYPGSPKLHPVAYEDPGEG